MALRQICPPDEVSVRPRFKRSSRPEALQAWAGFLAPKEAEQIRLLTMPHHGSRTILRLGTAVEPNVGRAPMVRGSAQTPQQASPEGAPSDPSRFAAHVLRDRFPPDIEEQIEQAWGDSRSFAVASEEPYDGRTLIVDSSTWIKLPRAPRAAQQAFLSAVAQGQIRCSPVMLIEILFGADDAVKLEEEREALEELRPVPVTASVCRAAVQAMVTLAHAGSPGNPGQRVGPTHRRVSRRQRVWRSSSRRAFRQARRRCCHSTRSGSPIQTSAIGSLRRALLPDFASTKKR